MIINVSDYTKEAIEKEIGKETGIEFFSHAMYKEKIANSNTIAIKTDNHGPGTQILNTKYFQEIKNALRLVDCGGFYLRYQGAQKTGNVITWQLKVNMKKKSPSISLKISPQKPEGEKEEIAAAEIIEHLETKEPVVVEVDMKEMESMIKETETPSSFFVTKKDGKNKKKIKPKEVKNG